MGSYLVKKDQVKDSYQVQHVYVYTAFQGHLLETA